MKQKVFLLLVVCALILGSMSSVSAVTDHNFRWGIDVGDRFHYRFRSDQEMLSLNLYVEINSLPTIPADVNGYYDLFLNYPDYSFYFENGTEIGYAYMWGAFAVGNWPLIQQFMNSSLPEYYEFINTFSEWGLRYTEDWGSLNRTTTWKFSKSDGVLTLYRVVEDPEIGFNRITQMTRTGLLSSPYLYIAIGVGVVALIAIVVVVMKRR